MKEQIEKRFAALLSVKSITTVVLTVVFAWLAVGGVVSGQEFVTVYSVVIAFYFGTQSQKQKNGPDEPNG